MGGDSTRPFLEQICLSPNQTHRGDPCKHEKIWNFFRENNQNPITPGTSGAISQSLSQIGDKKFFCSKNGRVLSPPIPVIISTAACMADVSEMIYCYEISKWWRANDALQVDVAISESVLIICRRVALCDVRL